MQLDPPLNLAHRFPVSTTVAVASIVLSILYWVQVDLTPLFADRDTVVRAPWTLVTATFLHVNPIHLLFNLSWWWPFACRIEHVWGRKRLIGITILFAVISSAAQIAFAGPGIGLSGVIFGIFALLVVVQDTHHIFRGLISRSTVWMMAGWFVLCIILTVTDVMPIGNVAHGAGAAAGYLLGRCITAAPGGRTRTLWIASLAAVGLLSIAGNFVTIPFITPKASTYENASRGTDAYIKGDYQEAARLLELAHRADPDNVRITYNLGMACQQLGRDDEALALYREVAAKEPSLRSQVAPAIAWMINQQAAASAKAGDFTTAVERLYETLEWQPDDDYAHELLHYIRQKSSGKPASK